MSRYLLGIDIGTSACKVAVFNREGKAVATANGEYSVYYPHEGWAQQNPEEWWKAVCLAVKKVIDSGINPGDIAGVGIDGQSWSAIAVDKMGRVLTDTPIWMDVRAKNICDRINEKVGADKIFELSGNSLQPSYSTAKILWYRENMPDVYRNIYKILQSNSYIAFRLTGKITQDVSQGYGLHCFDMRKGCWDEKMCEALEIPMEFLPEIHECSEIIGTVSKDAAAESGLKAGTPVVAGGLDAACGTLGAGVIHTGETQEQGGQAGGMSICLDECKTDPRLIMSYHVVSGKWLLQGGTTGGGGVMRWLEHEFGAYERSRKQETGKSSLDAFNELAAAVPAGSDGMVFLPYMSGERSPIWDPKAKGVYYGIDFGKTKGHFIRSAMEGVAFALKHNLDIAERAGAKVNELRAMGGSANSVLWTQIKADITGRKIIVPSSDTATTLGAAILAGVGTGMYESFDEAVRLTVRQTRRHEPDMSPEVQNAYDRNYRTYLELYRKLKDVMDT